MHVGKVFPSTPIYNIAFAGWESMRPLRYFHFEQISPAPVGTVPVQWSGVSMFSEPCALRPDGQAGWYYRFENPTNANLLLEVLGHLIPRATPDSNGIMFAARVVIQFTDTGSVVSTVTVDRDVIWFFGNQTLIIGPIGPAPGVPLATWTRLDFRVDPVQWTDNPPYHPYRH